MLLCVCISNTTGHVQSVAGLCCLGLHWHSDRDVQLRGCGVDIIVGAEYECCTFGSAALILKYEFDKIGTNLGMNTSTSAKHNPCNDDLQ